MRKMIFGFVALAVASMTIGTAIPALGYDRPTTFQRVSIASSGAQAEGHSSTDHGNAIRHSPSISWDGRYVAFASTANNLVTTDRNLLGADIFVHDRLAGETELVSVTTAGDQVTLKPAGQGGSKQPMISGNGRYVAFVSRDILDPMDENCPAACWRVYVRDLKRGVTERVSVDSAGASANSDAMMPSISYNGRYVTFVSVASNLGVEKQDCPIPDTFITPCGDWHVYAHDRHTGKTGLVSVNSEGVPANGNSLYASLSGDGRFVAFTSWATNLAPGNSGSEAFLHDMRKKTTEIVSVPPGSASCVQQPADPSCEEVHTVRGALGNSGIEGGGGLSVSRDGRFVAFWTSRGDLTPAGSEAAVMVFDRKTERLERVNVSSSGEPHDSNNFAAISPDGRYVSYQLWDCGETSTPPESCLAVFDRLTGAEHKVTPVTSTTSLNVWDSNMVPGGRYVVFGSNGENLVPGDTNQSFDVFVADRGSSLGAVIMQQTDRMELGPRARSWLISGTDRGLDGLGQVVAVGADLTGVRIVYRRELSDIYVRLDLDRMLPISVPAASDLLYGVRFAVGAAKFELRATSGGMAGRFGLFRCPDSICTKVADLKGGYGTTGERVVVSVPLADLGLEDHATISDLSAFSAVGTLDAGAIRLLDTITLR